jgi:hypothetical protein
MRVYGGRGTRLQGLLGAPLLTEENPKRNQVGVADAGPGMLPEEMGRQAGMQGGRWAGRLAAARGAAGRRRDQRMVVVTLTEGGRTTARGGATYTPAGRGGATYTPAGRGGATYTPAGRGGATYTPAGRGGAT